MKVGDSKENVISFQEFHYALISNTDFFFSGNLLLFKLPTYQAGFSAGTLNIRDMFLYIFLRFIHILFERRNKSTWFKSLHKLMCPCNLYINHKEILSLYSLSLLQCYFRSSVCVYLHCWFIYIISQAADIYWISTMWQILCREVWWYKDE